MWKFFKKNKIQELPVQHDWELLQVNYASPKKITSFNGLDQKTLEKVLLGVSTYIWRCKNTGELMQQEVLGRDRDDLDDIIDKIDKFGMQYIRQNGKLYAMTEYVPPRDQIVVKNA